MLFKSQLCIIFLTPKRNSLPTSSYSLFLFLPSPWKPLIYFVSMNLLVLDISIQMESYNIQPLASDFFHEHNVSKVDPCCTSFFFMAVCSIVELCRNYLFIYQLMTFGLFSYLATMNNSTRNIHVQVFFFFGWIYVFISPGYTCRSGIAWSYGNSRFNLLRNCQVIFQSGCTILNFHQQYLKALTSSHPCQYLLLSRVLIKAILVGVKWSLIWFWLNFLND